MPSLVINLLNGISFEEFQMRLHSNCIAVAASKSTVNPRAYFVYGAIEIIERVSEYNIIIFNR